MVNALLRNPEHLVVGSPEVQVCPELGPDPADLEGPARGCAPQRLVVGQGELRLRDAHGEAIEPRLSQSFEVLEGGRVVLYVPRVVDLRRDVRDLLFERIVVPICGPNRAWPTRKGTCSTGRGTP